MDTAKTVLLYPTEDSVSVVELLEKEKAEFDSLVVIDSTWQYAKEMVN